MSEYNVLNYTEQDGGVTHIGGTVVFDDGAVLSGAVTQVANLGATSSTAQLIAAMKRAGVMKPDTLTLTYGVVTSDNESVRAGNTAHIDSVSIVGDVITVTLDCKVSELADFDARGNWGVHKWLGIGLTAAGISDITDLVYNGSALSAEDVTEAANVGLSSGYFVRWIAADTVLAEDNTQPSKNYFTLTSDCFEKNTYTIKIVEG